MSTAVEQLQSDWWDSKTACETEVFWSQVAEEIGPLLQIGESAYQRVEHLLTRLHAHLMSQSPAYRGSMAAAKACGSPQGEPWSWQALFERRYVSAGVLTVRNRLPLHDHPKSNGALFVVAGRVAIDRFHLDTPTTGGLATLQRVTRCELGPGQVSTVAADYGNIHSLEAKAFPCITLNIGTPPYQGADRCWYFPVEPVLGDAATVAAQRVSFTRLGRSPSKRDSA